MVQEIDARRREALGPAERIVTALIQHADHIVHHRPGIAVAAPRSNLGMSWQAVSWKDEDGRRVLYGVSSRRDRAPATRLGVLADGKVWDGDREVGEFRLAGLFPEAAAWAYRQIAEVYKLDNELAARWASWAFPREHRDLKVLLAAFMLVQSRTGEPVREDGRVAFRDDDYRAVGEAMCLLRARNDLNPKLLLRIGDVLNLPQIAAINRELGFGKSGRAPARGRYYKAVEKWLRNRENNPRLLEGLVKAGFRTSVMALARRVGYKPLSPKFFEILRWKQKQASDGRRGIAIGAAVSPPETWDALTEAEICRRIVAQKPGFKRLVGLLPPSVGLTPAVCAAAIEAGSLSDTDLIIFTPTLEELGLLAVPDIRARWRAAMDRAENQRAANVARNVKSRAVADELQVAAEKATKAALEEVSRDFRVYVIVDKSGSMQGAIETAKSYLAKFLHAFSLDRLHVSVFNTVGTEVTIKSATAAGIEQAFKGHAAGGGTSYAEGVRVLARRRPADGEDALMIFVGDQEDGGHRQLADTVRSTGSCPVAFGLLEVRSPGSRSTLRVVELAAEELGIPCFRLDEGIFADPYAVTRTLRNLIAAAPVAAGSHGRLLDEILQTPLLEKPVWA
ncbi:MAG: VWA domain-containing protein [Candidatus Schekmanbacteria bacterium]|nr:VWA domain-containing protein [Candidatus Schekmanbacteria bacterium]